MAHEIQEHDNVWLHKQRAWHGLGIVEDESLTPIQALQRLNMDYEVQPWSLTAHGPNGETIDIDSHVFNVRSDINYPFAPVAKNYQVVQPKELAMLCEALAEGEDVVKVESVGSIRNGAKMWFLLKGESFSVREDEVIPYYCISNGHDGMTSISGTPTTIRVVCSNTLHMVVPEWKDGTVKRIRPAGFRFRHVGNVMERIEEAKRALQLYNKSLDDTRKVIDFVAAKDIKGNEDIQKFFLECYTADYGPIPSNPQTAGEERKRWNAMVACNRMGQRFSKEIELVGTNYWAAINAYTGWMQNDKSPRTKDEVAAMEQKVHSKLFGVDAQRAHHALQVALAS